MVARRTRPAFALAILLAVLSGPLAGQEPSVRAYLTPGNVVGVGGAFVLNVEISGTQTVDRDPRLPDLEPYGRLLGSSTQTAMRVVNGVRTVSLTIQYRYQALQEGAVRIPSFEVVASGRTMRTDPLDLTVATEAPQAAQSGPTVGSDDLFITAEASQARVREGEPFVVEYRIWTKIDVTNFGMTNVPELEGFWVEEVTPAGPPEVEQLVRDGQQYASAVIRRVALVPTGPGDRTLEPIGVEAQVRIRGGRDPLQDFFGRNSLFGSTTVPVTVLSNPLTVTVDPLPPGRPDDFTGLVGSLTAAAALDRDSIAANDAVTLTVRISGDGNVSAVPAPTLDFPADFEVFPPEISESVRPTDTGLTGSKTFEYVLIPRAPGEREVPSARFAYFDAGTNSYRVVETGPRSLTVSGTAMEGPAALARGGVSLLREDIRFIRLGPLDLEPAERPLLTCFAFWLIVLLPLAGLAGGVVQRRHADQLRDDVGYARGRRASRVARKRLAEARRLSEGSDARAFYAEVARALVGLVTDRLNLSEAGSQATELDEALAGAGVDAEIRGSFASILEDCDRQRFAPPATDPAAQSRFLERATELMTTLDRSVR